MHQEGHVCVCVLKAFERVTRVPFPIPRLRLDYAYFDCITRGATRSARPRSRSLMSSYDSTRRTPSGAPKRSSTSRRRRCPLRARRR